MIKLIKGDHPGEYYTPDRKWYITKAQYGWDAAERNERLSQLAECDIYTWVFGCETLKEIRESL